ncbi:MAG: glutathione S-transferase N-terminal domain-containing protein [Pseudomonadota bacterium]|nr:glutathione S-transferase N-terminal domain-containing protein [Pseudomonadota bacterium]
MKLYGSHSSPFARKVRVVLSEKRLDYEFVPTDVAQADHPAQAYNPLGKIPVLLLPDGTPVYDSAVIVEYLDTVSPVGRLIPEEARPRMLVKRWEALADGVMEAAVLLIMESRRAAELRSSAVDARQRGKVQRALNQIAHDLGERAHCCGDAFTLADAAIGSALFYLDFRFPEFAWREQHANLARLAERLEKRKSFEDTMPRAA